MSERQRIAVVLCGSDESELAVSSVADALRDEGIEPDVLLGVDRDAAMLGAATDRTQGRALFVLCQADGLGRSEARRLEGLFSARRGPDHRLITVDLPVRVPRTVVPQILGELRELERSRGSGRVTTDDDGRYMRDVVTPSSVAAAPGASSRGRAGRGRVERVPPGFVEEPQGITREALGLGEDVRVVEPGRPWQQARAPVPEPDVLISTDPLDTEEIRQREAEEAARAVGMEPGGDGVPTPVDEDYAVVGDPSSEVQVPEAPRGRPWERSGPVDVEIVARSRRVDPRAEADDRPLPSASAPIELDLPPSDAVVPEEPEAPRTGGFRLLLLLVAAAGMVCIVVMASLHASNPHGGPGAGRLAYRGLPDDGKGKAKADGGAADGASVNAGSASGGPAGPSTGASVAMEAEGSAGAVAGSTEGEAGAASGDDAAASDAQTSSASTGGDASASTGAADDGAAAAEESGEPASETAADDDGGTRPAGSTVPPPPGTSPSGEQLGIAIEAAIADGRLLAHDDLLAVPSGTSTMTWDEAAGKCKRKKVEDLRGWRLPSKGQLVRLRKAGLISSGSFWSRSVVGGDEVYAFDAASGRLNVWLKIEPNARALCVRKRP